MGPIITMTHCRQPHGCGTALMDPPPTTGNCRLTTPRTNHPTPLPHPHLRNIYHPPLQCA
eukprot:8799092-Karenia_brevis.AAC.1